MMSTKIIIIVIASIAFAGVSIGMLGVNIGQKQQTTPDITIIVNDTTPPPQFVPVLDRAAERIQEEFGVLP